MLEFLSDIELYYSPVLEVGDLKAELTGEEFHHSVHVMRKKVGDTIYVTNGRGVVIFGVIDNIKKEALTIRLTEQRELENKLGNITFCFPVLKNPDRIKFIFEKCTELGITKFILFNSARSIAKVRNIEKWNKTLLSAMKQSLRTYLPSISVNEDIKTLFNLNGEKIVFDQKGKKIFSKYRIDNRQFFLIFGPEGGLNDEELSFSEEVYKISDNRLRTETAIIKCASLIS